MTGLVRRRPPLIGLPGSAPRAAARETAPRAPWPLVAAGLVIAFLALLPLVYLVIRAFGAEASAAAFLLRPRTAGIVLGTVGLALLVGMGTIALGVPIAWLTTRTDLPGRRLWAVLTAIPLAIPSYVVGFAFLAFFGPRGTLQGILAPARRGPPAVDRRSVRRGARAHAGVLPVRVARDAGGDPAHGSGRRGVGPAAR